MKYLLDTSVLVAALVSAHPMHKRAQNVLLAALRPGNHLILASHSLAEVFAVLTVLPVVPRILPPVAQRLIAENFRHKAEIKTLSGSDYLAVIEELAGLGLEGGVIYDALIAKVARNAEVDRLVTFNPEHFAKVWPDGADRICLPQDGT